MCTYDICNIQVYTYVYTCICIIYIYIIFVYKVHNLSGQVSFHIDSSLGLPFGWDLHPCGMYAENGHYPMDMWLFSHVFPMNPWIFVSFESWKQLTTPLVHGFLQTEQEIR